jgi:hypothetical protein|tara:strand:+ start:488 stop:676 length:189 start_codon:yes stop_codon:yes gene_type:complete
MINPELEKLKKQLDQIEKTVNRIESDTVKLHKKLDGHIQEIWDIYKKLQSPIKLMSNFWKKQ